MPSSPRTSHRSRSLATVTVAFAAVAFAAQGCSLLAAVDTDKIPDGSAVDGQASVDGSTGTDGATSVDGTVNDTGAADAGRDAASSDAGGDADATVTTDGSTDGATTDATDADSAADDGGVDAAPDAPPAPTCTDGTKNGSETDTDCGGSTCGKCADTKACGVHADCTSGVCTGNVCQARTCSDQTKNGGETDVDCGGTGTGCPACANTKACTSGPDCTSGICTNLVCSAATCTDNVKNGGETDLNCGGDDCPKCADTKACALARDCASGVCSSMVCQAPACPDGAKNGAETDVDCGGSNLSCARCADTKACTTGSDCTSGVCTGDTCRAPTCTDNVKNGTETATDCGDGVCPKCANGVACTLGVQCASGICAGNLCVQCVGAGDCPGSDNECSTKTCIANTCGRSNAGSGTLAPPQTTGDCKVRQCDGNGNVVQVNDDGDPNVDGNACTLDTCASGVPSNPNAPNTTTCTQNGGSFCNGAGACVACNVAAQCPGTDTTCRTRTCNSNACGFSFAGAGTNVSGGMAGDCKKTVCDGSGNVVPANDDTDLPVDGNACTSDVCTNGVPSNPPVLPGGTCTGPNGAHVCDGAGACVQCVTMLDCPTDRLYFCSGNMCFPDNDAGP